MSLPQSNQKPYYGDPNRAGAQDIFNRYAGGSNQPNRSNPNSGRDQAVIQKDGLVQAPRTNFNKIYTNQAVANSRRTTKVEPERKCPIPLLALIGLLAIAGIVLGILFGLGIIGGKRNNQSAEQATRDALRQVVIDGVSYKPDSITIEKQVLKYKQFAPSTQTFNSAGLTNEPVDYNTQPEKTIEQKQQQGFKKQENIQLPTNVIQGKEQQIVFGDQKTTPTTQFKQIQNPVLPTNVKQEKAQTVEFKHQTLGDSSSQNHLKSQAENHQNFFPQNPVHKTFVAESTQKPF